MPTTGAVDNGGVNWVIFAVVLCSAAWVGYDAHGRDWRNSQFVKRTWIWVAGTLLLWIVFFPLYIYQRARVPLKT